MSNKLKGLLDKAEVVIVGSIIAVALCTYIAINSPRTGGVVGEVYMPSTIVTDTFTNNVAKRIEILQPGEVYILHINGYGGEVASGLEILNAMETTKGKVKVIVSGYAMSMYADIAVSANELEVGPNSLFMFHTVQVHNGLFDVKPLGDDAKRVEMENKILEKYNQILTPEEREHINASADNQVNLLGSEVKARFDRLHNAK